VIRCCCGGKAGGTFSGLAHCETIRRGRFGSISIPDFSDWKNHEEYQKASFGFAQDKFWAVDGGFEGGGRRKVETRRQKAESRRDDGDVKAPLRSQGAERFLSAQAGAFAGAKAEEKIGLLRSE
jgi:hypothetical protein